MFHLFLFSQRFETLINFISDRLLFIYFILILCFWTAINFDGIFLLWFLIWDFTLNIFGNLTDLFYILFISICFLWIFLKRCFNFVLIDFSFCWPTLPITLFLNRRNLRIFIFRLFWIYFNLPLTFAFILW